MSPSSKSEAELVALFHRSGDHQAFEELAERYLPLIRRTLFLKLRNREEADEALQDVLIALYRSLGNFSGRASLSTWLFRICCNVAVDSIRKKKRLEAKTARLRLFSRDGEDTGEGDPHRAAERNEEASLVLAALDTLGEPDRTILYLRDGEGASVADIAKAVGIPEGTVKSKLSRSREKLKNNPAVRGILRP